MSIRTRAYRRLILALIILIVVHVSMDPVPPSILGTLLAALPLALPRPEGRPVRQCSA